MAEYKDYYRILGVNRDADGKEIKKAYRKLARQHHPDVNPGDKKAEERFKEINEAYEVLSDPEKRARYDQLGSQYQQWQRTGGQGNIPWEDLLRQAGFGPMGGVEYREYPGGAGVGGFSDFFEMMFGGLGGTTSRRGEPRVRQAPRNGRDIDFEVTITLEEAFHGVTRVLDRAGQKLSVRIPPGAKTGTRIRLGGKGEEGYAGGQPGDLFLVVKVQDDPNYERRGDDLYRDIYIDLYTAVLGGEVRVPTLGGDVRLRIPPGTSSGKTFRLAGRGMPILRSPNRYGDLYARVLVRVPERLTDEERALFERLAGLRTPEGQRG